MQIGYLYSRYPVLSQTFCDMEMLELERRGYDLLIGAVHPPLTTLRHEHIARFRAPVYYAPPAPVMALWEKATREAERWPQGLIERHERKYGPAFKAALRAGTLPILPISLPAEGFATFMCISPIAPHIPLSL